MNKIELIQDLIKMAEDLSFQDEEKLDALRRRAEMIIGKIFYDSSNYIDDLNNIGFYVPYYPASRDTEIREWALGQKKMLNLFNTILEELEIFPQNENQANIEFSNKIFIVHGHDKEMKQTVARTLEKLDLKPIILHEQPNEGRTIIEKFEDYADVSFAVVLLSPDDIGYSKSDKIENAKSRARQNVILELGFFIGKLGRKHVFVLYKEDNNFEMPSDYQGVLYIPYDAPGHWKSDLIKELKACGYEIDANKLF